MNCDIFIVMGNMGTTQVWSHILADFFCLMNRYVAECNQIQLQACQEIICKLCSHERQAEYAPQKKTSDTMNCFVNSLHLKKKYSLPSAQYSPGQPIIIQYSNSNYMWCAFVLCISSRSSISTVDRFTEVCPNYGLYLVTYFRGRVRARCLC